MNDNTILHNLSEVLAERVKICLIGLVIGLLIVFSPKLYDLFGSGSVVDNKNIRNLLIGNVICIATGLLYWVVFEFGYASDNWGKRLMRSLLYQFTHIFVDAGLILAMIVLINWTKFQHGVHIGAFIIIAFAALVSILDAGIQQVLRDTSKASLNHVGIAFKSLYCVILLLAICVAIWFIA